MDIIVCILLARKVARIVGEKGRSKAGWITVFVLLFFVGELAGGVTALIALGEPEPGLGVVLGAVVGAGAGAILGLAIVNSLSPVAKEPYWDELDDQDYGEKFDPRRPREVADGGSYRAKGDDVQPPSPDDTAYRPQEGDR
jgi:hypothetical protein